MKASRALVAALSVAALPLLGAFFNPTAALAVTCTASSPPSLCPSPSPSPTATPSPSPSPSPKGQVSVNPASAPPDSHITVSGAGFDPNLAITIVFDGGETPLATLTTSSAGTFSQLVVVPDGAGPDHTICARTPNGDICAGFRLQSRPSPTASPSPDPSPSSSAGGVPSPSPTLAVLPSPVPDSGTSPLAFVSRPPFVFFPLLVIAGLVGWLAYYLWSLRPPPRVQNVTVVHRAAQVQEYSPGAEPQAVPPPAAAEPLPPPPEVHLAPPPPAPPTEPGAPSAADVPPDLPTPSD